MTDDRRDYSALYAALESLREDVREDIGHLRDDVREDNERLEGRLMAAINDVRRDAVEFATAHTAVHEERRAVTDAEHRLFRDFIHAAELAQARRDGALGVFRFILEQLSRHWRPLLAVLSGFAMTAAFVTGSIHIEVVLA